MRPLLVGRELPIANRPISLAGNINQQPLRLVAPISKVVPDRHRNGVSLTSETLANLVTRSDHSTQQERHSGEWSTEYIVSLSLLSRADGKSLLLRES